MLNFLIDENLCTQCGACRDDCIARIIQLDGANPFILLEDEAKCYHCLHCLAICPTGALSIDGVKPDDCSPLAGNLPSPGTMATLIRGRRSVRQYAQEDLPATVIHELLQTAWQAPTGVNSRQVRFTVLDTQKQMHAFRDEVMVELAELVRTNRLAERFEMVAKFVQVWQESKLDIIFRDAPHLVVASAPKSIPTPVPDCLIALTNFDLYAQSSQIGTVWAGFVYLILQELLPHLRNKLEIPEDHLIGYAILFGKPAVQYERTVIHQNPIIHRPVW